MSEAPEASSAVVTVAQSPQMARFVKMIALKMADQVEIAVTSSVDAFVGIFRRYDFEDGSRGALAGRPDTEDGKWGADLYTSSPTQLLRVDLVYLEEERSLELRPTPEEITGSILEAFEEIFVQCEGIEDVSAKLALSMENTTLPNGEPRPDRLPLLSMLQSFVCW